MSARAVCPHQPSRVSLSNTATTVIAVIAAMTFSASGAAPTPLYQQYQEGLGLMPTMLTVIFAAYVLSLLMALLTTGSLSDHIGRRPVILWALMLNIVAMIVFMTASSAAALTAARAVQGFATGLAATAPGRDFVSQRARARFGIDDAGTARLHERLRHDKQHR